MVTRPNLNLALIYCVLSKQYLCTCIPTKATLGIDDQGDSSKAGEDSLYVFEGTNYSKSSAEDEKTFDTLVAGVLQCNLM